MTSSLAGPSTGDSFTVRLTGVPVVHNLDSENYCCTHTDWTGLRAEQHDLQSQFRLSKKIRLTVDGKTRPVKFQSTERLEQWTWEVASETFV
jgi:hypothetical protein